MTYLDELHRFEDQEQAKEVSKTVIDLPYDNACRITRGPLKGQDVGEAAHRIATGHREAGRTAIYRYVDIRPWWRLWRETPAIRITVNS